MLIFNRSKNCSVDFIGEELVARASFLDTHHEMNLEITVNPKDMIVKKVEATIIRAPYKPCHDVAERIKVLEGIKIGRGMTKNIWERFGGRFGCVHLSDLFIDGTKALITARYSWLGLTSEDFDKTAQEVIEQLKGTCYAYTQESVLNNINAIKKELS
ncbi:MAG: DUF2889 domain-containing protein [Peptococcia bacterium]